MAKRKKIKVLIVDDHPISVSRLKYLIGDTSDLEVAGSLLSAEGLVETVVETNAQIVLLDIEMPGPDPFEAMEDLRRQTSNVQVIILSAYVRDHYIDTAVAAGAWGYLSKNDDLDTIVDAIRKVSSGEFVFGPAVMGRCTIKKTGHETGGLEPKLQVLTPREQQVLRMIGKGMSRAEIAKTLHRSPKTIDKHRASIMEKMNIHDRVELVLYAVREGLVEA